MYEIQLYFFPTYVHICLISKINIPKPYILDNIAQYNLYLSIPILLGSEMSFINLKIITGINMGLL